MVRITRINVTSLHMLPENLSQPQRTAGYSAAAKAHRSVAPEYEIFRAATPRGGGDLSSAALFSSGVAAVAPPTTASGSVGGV
jgi:hypothetical protein